MKPGVSAELPALRCERAARLSQSTPVHPLDDFPPARQRGESKRLLGGLLLAAFAGLAMGLSGEGMRRDEAILRSRYAFAMRHCVPYVTQTRAGQSKRRRDSIPVTLTHATDR